MAREHTLTGGIFFFFLSAFASFMSNESRLLRRGGNRHCTYRHIHIYIVCEQWLGSLRDGVQTAVSFLLPNLRVSRIAVSQQERQPALSVYVFQHTNVLSARDFSPLLSKAAV